MREFTETQYIKHLVGKYEADNKRLIPILNLALFFLGLGFFVLYPTIKLNFLNIPLSAQTYLLKTEFYRFSNYDLEQILLQTNTNKLLSVLVWIYWGQLTSLVMGGLLLGLLFSLSIIFKSYEKGLSNYLKTL